ncbi:hypothetical protein MXB_1748 [Myxobolus squamalis]|nr:hypothetical protein MXB_1748 [Myxobolus squamalis]
MLPNIIPLVDYPDDDGDEILPPCDDYEINDRDITSTKNIKAVCRLNYLRGEITKLFLYLATVDATED